MGALWAHMLVYNCFMTKHVIQIRQTRSETITRTIEVSEFSVRKYEQALNKPVVEFTSEELASLARASQIFDDNCSLSSDSSEESAEISLLEEFRGLFRRRGTYRIKLDDFSIRQFFRGGKGGGE